MNDINFELNERYTLVDNATMGVTIKNEITIADISDGCVKYKKKGKHKLFPMPTDAKLQKYMIFRGHNLPLRVHSECKSFIGSRNFTFITDKPDELREFLRTKCLNARPENLAKAVYLTFDGEKSEGTALFPPDDNITV